MVLQWKKEKKISWCQPAKTLARRRQDALSGDNEHGREPRTPNLIKKFTPKKRTINTESLCEQWCSLHPKLNCHRVPTSPTAHNGLMTDLGHLSEFHKEGFQNRLQKIWVLILQENKLWGRKKLRQITEFRKVHGLKVTSCAAELNSTVFSNCSQHSLNLCPKTVQTGIMGESLR